MKSALLIIDIQKDYFEGGRNPLEGPLEASERAKAALAAFRKESLPVVHVQHISNRPGATFFLPDSEGAKIHPNVAPLPNETVILKHYPSAFRETRLEQQLKAAGIEHLVIGGMMTHMCVDATTRAACDLGFQCTLLHDACATKALAFGNEQVAAAKVHAAFVAALGSAYAKVLSTKEYLGGM